MRFREKLMCKSAKTSKELSAKKAFLERNMMGKFFLLIKFELHLPQKNKI